MASGPDRNAWRSSVEVLGLLGLLVVLLLREISDPDIWGYLVVGREIANTLAIPTHEFYLFPAVGEPRCSPRWGTA